ncbi:MAG: Calx-beta domain-containing protein [Pirellulaceae bacterium]
MAAASSDSKYDAIAIDSVAGTNEDNEIPVTISAPSASSTDETGSTSTFSIVLDQQPTSNVVIALASSDTSEATIDVSSVTFTPQNWNVPQTITVTGVDDFVDDGNVPYSIITESIVSNDQEFSGLNPPNVALINNDDGDTVGVTVTPLDDLVTSEQNGSAVQLSIVLVSQPTGPVAISVDSSDTTEGIVSSAVINFTVENWNVPQTVTVSGVDDDVDDGNIAYDVSLSVTSGDESYNGFTLPTFSFSNTDDDQAGVTIVPATDLITGEDGTTDTFTVVLDSQPTADVTITLASSNTAEGTVDPQSLTFTASNWDQPQLVTLTGIDDDLEDDRVDYTVSVSVGGADSNYSSLTIPAITATNIDDEVGVRITPVSGLETSETGSTAFFDVVLTRQPESDVSFDLMSSNTSEVTLSHASLTFTTENWNVPQRVTATGVDDAVVDGNKSVLVTTSPVVSNDTRFAGFNPRDVTIVNNDNDSATLQLTASSTSQVEGTGDGAIEFTFTIELSGAVENGFTVAYATDDATAVAGDDYVDNDGVLTFDGTDGESKQVVVLVNRDNIVERDEQFQFALGELSAAMQSIVDRISLDGDPINLTIQNDDTATITLAGIASRDEGTDSANDTIEYSITLSNPVQDGLTLAYATSDGTAVSGDDYVANSGTLTFAGAAETQTVSVRIVRDNKVEIDENFVFSIGPVSNVVGEIANSVDIDVASITTTLANDDAATIEIVVVESEVEEGSSSTTTPVQFQVTLSAPVQGGLTIPFSVVDGTATVADNDFQAITGSIVFADGVTTSQQITIDVNQDDRVESNETFTVQLGTPTGPAASILEAISVATTSADATIVNDDFPRLVLSPLAPMQAEGTGDDMTTLSFTVRLTDAVAGGFTLPYTLDGVTAIADVDFEDNDGTLTFAGEEGETKTIIVRIARDQIVEGDETFELNLGQVVGASQRVDIPDAKAVITIVDDDSTTLTISETNLSQTEGTGSGTTEFVYTVTLSNPVQTPFQLPYATADGTARASDGDYTAADSQLSFSGLAGEEQTVRIVVARDAIVETNENFVVNFAELVGVPTSYANRVNVDFTSATGTITDDDTATITVSDVSGSENAGNLTFNVVSSAIVQGGFGIGYSVVNGTATAADGDFVANSGSLQFNNVAQRSVEVQVTGDAKVERDETFELRLANLTGLPASLVDRVTIADSSATGTIRNDDTARVAFVNATSVVQEAAGLHSFELRLDAGVGGSISEPITVNITASTTGTASGSDFTLSTPTLTFPAGSSTGATQTVRLQLIDDNVQESPETVSFSAAITGETIGGAVTMGTPASHTVEIQDDPRTGVVSGSVWVDGDHNQTAGSHDHMLSGVTLRLSGVDRLGQSITASTVTDAQGHYRFSNLPAGTYTVTQDQPEKYHDGNPVAGSAQATVSSNQISGIVIEPAGVSADNSFMEAGLKAQYVRSSGRLLARPIVREAATTSQLGNVQIQQSGSQVLIVGSQDRDVIEVMPAQTASGQHTLIINGQSRTFDAAMVSTIKIEGHGGDDDVILHDTTGNDKLTAANDTLLLETEFLNVESIANEFVRATSTSGTDTSTQEAIDFVLRLAGNWNE